MEWFIQIHRKMLEWERYDDINTKVLFIHLLIKANWKDKKWRWIEIERWTFITSFETLKKETWLSLQNIRTSLNKLILTKELTKESHSSYTLIKLLNYNEYQETNTQTNKRLTNEQQTTNKRLTTTNKVNKENKDNNILVTKVVATKVATLETYIKENFDLEFITSVYEKYNMNKKDFQEECESFVDYWKEKSISWKKEKRQMQKTFDPKLRFRTWIKRSNKWSNNLSNKKWAWITTI